MSRTVDDLATDERLERATVPWSPAQIIGLIVGIGFTALGIAAVAATGFDTDDIYQPQERVWGFMHSPLLAVCEIGFGVLLIVASIVPGGIRPLMALLGVVAVVFGILIVAEVSTDDMTRWFGVTDKNGWLYIIAGGVVALAAMLSPIFLGHRTTVTRRQNSVRAVPPETTRY